MRSVAAARWTPARFRVFVTRSCTRCVALQALESPSKRMVKRSSNSTDEQVPSFLRNPVAAVKARRKSISYEWVRCTVAVLANRQTLTTAPQAWTPVLSAMEVRKTC